MYRRDRMRRDPTAKKNHESRESSRIDFENQRPKKDCNDERRMLRRYGSKRTKRLSG